MSQNLSTNLQENRQYESWPQRIQRIGGEEVLISLLRIPYEPQDTTPPTFKLDPSNALLSRLILSGMDVNEAIRIADEAQKAAQVASINEYGELNTLEPETKPLSTEERLRKDLEVKTEKRQAILDKRGEQITLEITGTQQMAKWFQSILDFVLVQNGIEPSKATEAQMTEVMPLVIAMLQDAGTPQEEIRTNIADHLVREAQANKPTKKTKQKADKNNS